MKKGTMAICLIVGIVVLFAIVSCATTVALNEDNFSSGKCFKSLILKHRNSSMPIEEHGYVIIITRDTGIETIGWKEAKTLLSSAIMEDLIVLPPGEHELGLNWPTRGTYDKMTVNILPGHYYFLAFQEKTEKRNYLFDDIENYSELLVGGYSILPRQDGTVVVGTSGQNDAISMIMPIDIIISGINAKIATKFPEFKGRPAAQQ